MASLVVVDKKGKEVDKLTVSDEIIKQEINTSLLHQEVKRFLASCRAGTHNTKGRSEVRGGGRKPWRQKGTGNARAGSIRSPLWKGGGVVFGPKPREHTFKLNKKVRSKTKLMALSDKFNEKKLVILDQIKFDKPKTKDAFSILKNLGLDQAKVLVVIDKVEGDEGKSFRNIPGVIVASANSINTYLILASDFVLFTKDALKKFMEGQKDERS
jgi:large subunit ribosomal protein L4